jgi:hypothetical protein
MSLTYLDSMLSVDWIGNYEIWFLLHFFKEYTISYCEEEFLWVRGFKEHAIFVMSSNDD